MALYATHNTRSIFAPVAAVFFTSTQMEECRDFLAARSANTECVPIVDERQLLLSGDGRIAENGYRFNPIGFDSLGKALSGGLVSVFNELSGEVSRRVPKSEAQGFDVPAAVSIYNTALRVRFEALRERTLLVNHQERSIDGFLGLDHRLLDNTEFFDVVCRALEDRQPDAQFSRAEVIGRELRMFFIDGNSRGVQVHSDSRHTFAAGWYFSNREDVGQAVRGSTCIYTKFGVAFEPANARSKVVHAGADMLGRTSVMATRVATQTVDMAKLTQQVRYMLSTSMQFSDNKKNYDAATKQWVTYLCKFKIKADVALAIVKNAALVGSDLHPRDPLEVFTKGVMEGRMLYDLLCAILRYAKNEYATHRDLLQGVAMQLLVPEKKSDSKKFY